MATSLSTEQLIGLTIFASYFLGIFFLFTLVVQSIAERRRDAASSSWIYIGLAFASFSFTWYCEYIFYLNGGETENSPSRGHRYDIIHAMEFHGLRAKRRNVKEHNGAYTSARRKLVMEYGALRAGMDYRVRRATSVVVERAAVSVHGGLLDGFSLDERYVICT